VCYGKSKKLVREDTHGYAGEGRIKKMCEPSCSCGVRVLLERLQKYEARMYGSAGEEGSKKGQDSSTCGVWVLWESVKKIEQEDIAWECWRERRLGK